VINTSHIPLTGIASLSEPELFALCAARVYRESREHPARHCTCLQHIFVAARMSVALPKFLEMQIALGADSKQILVYEERSAQLVGSGEIALLRALSTWQHDLASDPTDGRPVVCSRARDSSYCIGCGPLVCIADGWRRPGLAGHEGSFNPHNAADL